VSEKTIRVCDGCERELEKVSEVYHLVLKTDRYWDGVEDTDHLEALDFCDRCAKDVKRTLQKIAEKK